MDGNLMKKVFKKCCGLVLGILLALGFYYGILVDLGLDQFVLKLLKISLCVLMGVGCFFSEELQCVGLICMTMFCSLSGRKMLQAMIFALLIAGPGENIIHNGKEVARTFGCSAELTFNLTKEYTNLVVAPFRHAIMGLKEDDADSVSEALKSMNQQIAPIKSALDADEKQDKKLEEETDYVDRMQGNSLRTEETGEKYAPHRNESEGDEVERKYMKSLETKCQGIISRSTERCSDSFLSAYESCKEKVSVFVSWLVCWPMKLTFVCDIITLMAGGKACDATENVEPGYGESYTSLINADKNLGKQMGKTKFHYKLPRPDVKLNLKDAASSVRNVMADVRVKIDAAEVILLVLRRLLLLIFLPVILQSVKYVNLYLMKLDHDNHYITSQFNAMNARRVKAGRVPSLLPLRHEERSKLVNIYVPTPNGPEKKNIFGPYLKLLMLSLIAGVVLSTDSLLAHTLSLVAKHGKTEITQSGHHVIHITVRGSGFVAKMVRSMVQGFNMDERIHNIFSNEACLPQPHILDSYYLKKISLAFLGMASMVLFDHFPTRLRRTICSWFYPKREKQRTLHLYNTLLQSRSSWHATMSEKLKTKADELRQKETMVLPLPGPLQRLRQKLQSCLPVSRRNCALCLIRETRTRDFVTCPNCPKGIDFCPGCWADLEEICPACL